MDTEKLLQFIQFTHKFQQVKRIMFVTGESRNENDSEHSFQLALLAWYLNSSLKLNYDTDLIIKYSIVHDLVETYAGDIFFDRMDTTDNIKVKKEQEALERIEKEFPEFKELTELIHKYDERKDKESQFVYAVDKMIAVLNIYLDKGRSWKKYKVTFEMIRNKDLKIKNNKDVMKVWVNFMKLVEKDRKNLFGEK